MKPPFLAIAVAGCGADRPPDVVLISMDTVRADHLSTYRYGRPTSPWLDRLAATGVVFERSFSQSNESAWSHGALFTGRYPSELAAPEYRTWAASPAATFVSEVLQAHGYETAAFLAGGHVGAGFGFAQGFDHFEEKKGFATFWHTAPAALDWLDTRQTDRPYFLVLHGYDAHRPYAAPPPFLHGFAAGDGSALAERIALDGSDSERVFGRVFYPRAPLEFFTHPSGAYVLETRSYERLALVSSVLGEGEPLGDDDVAHLRAHYDGTIAAADLWVGLFLAAAERAGYLDDALVIVTSDHGEDLLDHDFVNHRTALYDTCVRVPLVVSGPGFPRGRRVHEMTQAIDVAPTVLRAAGAALPAGLAGRPLQDVAAGAVPPLDAVFVEGVMDMVAVRTDTHKLVYWGGPLDDPAYVDRLSAAPLAPPAFEMFDLIGDRAESRDLLATGVPAEAAGLRDQLVAWRRSLVVSTDRPGLDGLSPGQVQALRDHGYWEVGER